MGTKINWTPMIQQGTLGRAAWVQLQLIFLCIESGPHLLHLAFSYGLASPVMCLSITFELINDFIHPCAKTPVVGRVAGRFQALHLAAIAGHFLFFMPKDTCADLPYLLIGES